MRIMSGFEDLDNEDLKFLIETHKTHEEIIKLRKTGMSYEKIAKTVGWPLKTINVFLTTNHLSPDFQKFKKSNQLE
jgi:hypothetical protein